ncbi:MAG: alpha/beta hydrolase [Ilumatobacteraceae bacterium]
MSGHVDKAPVVAGAESWSHEGSRRVGALCIHGFTGNPSSMRGVAQAFANAGYHVELPRLPGHGTAVSDMIPTRWSDWSAEVERAYQRLSARVDKVVVAGLSMGGSLTLWTALEHPEVAGIVCVNPACQPQAVEMVDMIKGLIAEGTDVFPGIGSDIADPDVKESSYPETPLAALVSLVEDGVTPMLTRYGTSRVPMLLITSKNDHVVDPATSDVLAEQWGGEVRRILLERSYHVATQDFDKETIFAAAVAFGDEVTA